MNDLVKYEVRNPYPGLRPFRVEEKHLFFGREEQVDKMVEKLEAHRFLAVVGGSGSGKSSLVNCGLRPALHRGNMASAGSNWRMIQIRPGSDPFGTLAKALAEPDLLFSGHTSSVVSLQELVATTLRLGSLGLVDLIDQADLPSDTKVLVIVDQFEELFRFRSLVFGGRTDHFNPGEDAVAFVHLLLEAVTQTAVPIYIVITMRSDFLGECAQFCGLPEAINESQYLVPRLNRNEIRAAVTGPAALRGATLSPVLLARLLNDVGDNPDQLSILQHALNRTWGHMEKSDDKQDMLALHHYEIAGGMELALDQHADKAFNELTSAGDQRLCEQIFKVLTDVGTDPRGVRRPTKLTTLCEITGEPVENLAKVINIFRKPSRSFLMPPITEALEPQTPIDISHESLMRVWKRLKNWADEEAQSARFFCRLRDAAEDNVTYKGNEWRGLQLRSALNWRDKNKPTVAWAQLYAGGYGKAIAFLEASSKKQDEEDHKAYLESRWKRWRWVPNAATFIVFVVFVIWLREMLANWLESEVKKFEGKLEIFNAVLEKISSLLMVEWAPFVLAGMPAAITYILVAPFVKKYFPVWERWLSALATITVTIPRSIVAEIFVSTDSEEKPVDVEEHGYASFGRRALAELIDWVACWFGALIVASELFSYVNIEVNESLFSYIFFICVVFFFGLYHIICWHSKLQATFGMYIVGIIIINKTGHRLGLGRAAIRFFARWLSYYTAMLGFLVALFNKKNQTLHDKISGTLVVHREIKAHAVPELRRI